MKNNSDYYLENGSHLAREANRSLDFVSNMRIVPRSDSLISVIITYSVNNDVPIYEYQIIRGDFENDQGKIEQGDVGQRRIRQSTETPLVSRQRVDIRLNLDLNSKWKPLDGTRFFFQATNLFAPFNSGPFSYLGGSNQKQRGATRLEDWYSKRNTPGGSTSDGLVTPLLIDGLGLFILFGFEMDFSI